MRYRIKLPIEVESKGYEVRFEIVIPRDADNVLVGLYNGATNHLKRRIPNPCEELCGILLRATLQYHLNVPVSEADSVLWNSCEQDVMDHVRGCERLSPRLRGGLAKRAKILSVATNSHGKAGRRKQNCGNDAHLVSSLN